VARLPSAPGAAAFSRGLWLPRSVGSPPVNTALPSVSGTAQVGQTLTASPGTWSGSPAPSFAYQWQRGTSNISGATSATYTPVVGDVGSTLRVVVTATNSSGSAAAASASTAAVSAASTGDDPVAGWWSYRDAGISPTATTPAGQWSYYGQDGQQSYYGNYPPVAGATNSITTPAAYGLPAVPGGTAATRIYRLRKNAGDTAVHHKLYKSFGLVSGGAQTWPGGSEGANNNTYSHLGAPDDVSARYMSEQYIPAAEMSLLSGAFMNLQQFKEDYTDETGAFQSDPSWWVGLIMQGGIPYAQIAHWNITPGSYPLIDFRPYLDKWTLVELRLYQGVRVEFYLDGVLKSTGLNSEWRVGRKFYAGQAGNGGHTVQASKGWTFGLGNYLGPDNSVGYGSAGTVFVGPARVIPLSTLG
jgi:hypothetical protein